jgi:hypothetical protein
MYEKNENNSQLTYLRKLILPSKNFSKQKSNEVIRSLALSPNEETLLAGTNTNHLYEFSFSKIVNIYYLENLIELIHIGLYEERTKYFYTCA